MQARHLLTPPPPPPARREFESTPGRHFRRVRARGRAAADAAVASADADLVRIITVHRVKGLQYPVVFVPFTPFLGAKRPDAPWVFHSDTGQAQLDFGLEDGAGKYAAAHNFRKSMF